MSAAEDLARPVDGVSHGPEGDQIAAAARWAADHWHTMPHPRVGTIRRAYGLSFNDACKAIAEAHRLMGREAGR